MNAAPANVRPRLAVIGHVEHVVIARAPHLPRPSDILHLDRPETIAGGGGGIAFFQLARGTGELHLYTALGNDTSAARVFELLRDTTGNVYAARRDEAHTNDLVLVTPDGERTIMVVGEPLHPRADDPLPWDVLGSCDAVYFTAQDPAALRKARAARTLVVTARRREALLRSGVRADIVVGSARDPRESGRLADYTPQPRALVLTEGGAGGSIETADGRSRFAVPPAERIVSTYGAGDSFAGALTWYLAIGLDIHEACGRAAESATAVLRALNPIEGQLPLDR